MRKKRETIEKEWRKEKREGRGGRSIEERETPPTCELASPLEADIGVTGIAPLPALGGDTVASVRNIKHKRLDLIR